ncbi:glycogen synthase [Candidatus Chlorohelix allophototropha]|uniref:Glycogen synthase n=1 Tax=Candidatus Chlorohelix allophototropha TaxID=3003348 RepID=A0ABY9B0U3_9CHLR|nr:glycogen synthase [Chloroflexota bacterium L227-S17]
MKILIVAAEATPFAKVGHVAEVIGSLPSALAKLGHDVRLVIPRYGRISPNKFDLKPVINQLNIPLKNERTEPVSVLASSLKEEVPVYLIDSDRYFNREGIYGYPDDDERFILFCRAVLEMLPQLNWQPDVIHCHEWHTALIPYWLKTQHATTPFYRNIASVYTIHNLAYQGIFGYRVLEIAGIADYNFIYNNAQEHSELVSLMSLGIRHADIISTVSPSYAKEILSPQFGENMNGLLNERSDRLCGILNGIDTNHFNPATDRYLAATFDVKTLKKRGANKLDLQREIGLPQNPDIPLIGMITRLASQKGLDLLEQIINPLMQLNIQFVLMGTGDQMYHEFFSQIAQRYPDKMALRLTFNAILAQKIYGGSDIFLMPSRFEPCGLGQLIAMRYGSIPVVRKTGGLADTVQDFDPATGEGNGFSFVEYDQWMLFATIVRALETYKNREVWHKLMERDMQRDYSWDSSAVEYVKTFQRAIKLRQKVETV